MLSLSLPHFQQAVIFSRRCVSMPVSGCRLLDQGLDRHCRALLAASCGRQHTLAGTTVPRHLNSTGRLTLSLPEHLFISGLHTKHIAFQRLQSFDIPVLP